MRKTILTLTAPLILAAACAQGDGGPDEELIVTTDEVTGEITALYQVGGEEVQLATRRLAAEVGFLVEVSAVDRERGIELLAGGDHMSLEANGASSADKNHAMALFAEAMLAMEESDAAIPAAERRALGEIGEAASAHSDGSVLEPYVADDLGCVGEAFAPTFTPTSVIAKATIECVDGGKLQFKSCVRRFLIRPIGSRVWNYFFNASQHVEDMYESLVGKEDCFVWAEHVYDDPAPGTTLQLEGAADFFCGELGTTYSYKPSLKSVESFWPNVFLRDNWHTLAEGPSVIHTCGR